MAIVIRRILFTLLWTGGLIAIPLTTTASGAACTDVNPYHAPPGYSTGCGLVPVPLAATTELSDHGHSYQYRVAGTTVSLADPPASFDASTASEGERLAYGIPAQPPVIDEKAHALWNGMINNIHFVTAPAQLYTKPAEELTSRLQVPLLDKSEASENWAGYADTGSKGKYNSTGIIYEQPQVLDRCEGGEAAFWTGLGGDGTTPLDQAGTEVGGEQHGGGANQAWFEIYPQELPFAIPIEATAGQLFEVLLEHTSGNSVTAFLYNFHSGEAATVTRSSSETYSGASAEYITEYSPRDSLLNFQQFNVAEAWANGNHTQGPWDFSHTAMDIWDGSTRLTETSALSPQESGREFYTKWDNSGPTCKETAYPIVFQSATHGLYWRSPRGEISGSFGELAPDTSPAVQPDGQIVFQGSNHDLWVSNEDGTQNLGIGMAPNTSPAVQQDGQIVFQASNGNLEIRQNNGKLVEEKFGMAAGTSPVIAPDGEIAFEANTNVLWRRTPAGQVEDTGLSMAPGTSPALQSDGEIVFQGGNGHVWVRTSAGSSDLGLTMAPDTSPAVQPDGEIIFQAANHDLDVRTPVGHLVELGLGMAADTSPAIDPDGEMVFQANTGELWRRTAYGNDEDTHYAMAGGTSPGVAE
jgi:Peptidase A4 family